eukprot:8618718-Prorocentrum_lima.AAC.1
MACCRPASCNLAPPPSATCVMGCSNRLIMSRPAPACMHHGCHVVQSLLGSTSPLCHHCCMEAAFETAASQQGPLE